MSYLNYEQFGNNPYNELDSQDSNNNEDEDEKNIINMHFNKNDDDEESSNNYEHFYLNKKTAPKTYKDIQDELNNYNRNIFEKEQNNEFFFSNEDVKKNEILLNEEIEIIKDLSEKIGKENKEEKLELNKGTNINQIEIKEDKEDKNEENILLPPKQYYINDIKEKLNSISLIDIFIKNDNLKELEEKMSDKVFLAPKKRNRDKKHEINPEIKKCGRKKKHDTESKSLHTKDFQDNIVKKIKSKINGFLIMFINIIINTFLSSNKKKSYFRIIKKIPGGKEPKYEDLLKDLDYNLTVNEISKKKNLEFLNMPLKDYLSIDISDKFRTYSKESNKNVIDEIIKNEKGNEIIMFILNDLTLRDYIDIFLYKKQLKDFGKLDETKINLIMNKFIRVDKLIEEINPKENEKDYYSKFLYIFYNFERWFFIKIQRQKKEKKVIEDKEKEKIFLSKKVKKVFK